MLSAEMRLPLYSWTPEQQKGEPSPVSVLFLVNEISLSCLQKKWGKHSAGWGALQTVLAIRGVVKPLLLVRYQRTHALVSYPRRAMRPQSSGVGDECRGIVGNIVRCLLFFQLTLADLRGGIIRIIVTAHT